MKRIAMIGALACSLALAGPALAQEESIYDQNYEYGSYEATTSGTIDSFRVVNLSGFQDDHVVVRVQPPRAGDAYDFAFVHLGPRDSLRDRGIRISADQHLQARGQMGRINGRPVLFAEQIILDGNQYALGSAMRTSRDARHFDEARRDRWPDRAYDDEQTRGYDRVWPYEEAELEHDRRDALQEYRGDQARRTGRQHQLKPFSGATDPARNYNTWDRQRARDTRDMARTDRDRSERFAERRDDLYLVRGEVESLRDFEIDGIGDSHRLMKITDTTGRDARTFVVDLGPTDGALAELSLEEGDKVLVQGHRARIEGRPVIHAVQVAEVFSGDEDDFARGEAMSSRLRRDQPEPSDSPSRRVGKPQQHDQPSRTATGDNF